MTRPSAVDQGLSASDLKLRDPTDQEEVAIEEIPGAWTVTGPGAGRGGWACHIHRSGARLEKPMPSLRADGTIHTSD